MDRQFVFLNFHTEYSSKGTVKKPMRREYCFGDIFYEDHYQENEYNIRIYKNLSGVNNGAKNNACFMSKDELFNYISIAKRVHDFDLQITDEEKDNRFLVKLTLKAPRVVHRYILTWLRYSYEFPFNMYLADAMKMKNITGFKRDDLFNLFNLAGASCGYHFHGDRIHCIGDVCWPRKFYSIKEQVKTVNGAEDTSEVNSLFPELQNIKGFKTIYANSDDFRKNFESLEYWQDDKNFKARLEFYKSNKKAIKSTK